MPGDLAITIEFTEAFRRGALDAYQDRCENVPFASTGGLDNRHQMKPPDYVPVADRFDYMDGYVSAVKELFGDDWQTCEFGWQKALTIEAYDPQIGSHAADLAELRVVQGLLEKAEAKIARVEALLDAGLDAGFGKIYVSEIREALK